MRKITLFLTMMVAMVTTSFAQEALTATMTSPTNGVSNGAIWGIIIEFNKEVTLTAPAEDVPILDAEGNQVMIGEVLAVIPKDKLQSEASVTKLKFACFELFNTGISEPGVYKFTIPAGVVTATDGTTLPATEFTMQIKKPFEVSEYPDYTIEKIFGDAGISIKFDREIIYTAPEEPLQLINEKNGEPVRDVTITAGKDKLFVMFENDITESGTYVLTLPKGCVVDTNGEEYEGGSFTWIVEAPVATWSTNLAGNVTELNSFTISFENVNEVVLNPDKKDDIYVMIGGSERIATAEQQEGKNDIVVTFSEKIEDEGEYKVVIPAGMFTMDGVANETKTITVTVVKPALPLEIREVKPVEGVVNQISAILITFNQEVKVDWDKDYNNYELYLTKEGSDEKILLTLNTSYHGENGNADVCYLVNAEWDGFNYSIVAPITEAGTYTFDLSKIYVRYNAEEVYEEVNGTGFTNIIYKSEGYALSGQSLTWTLDPDATAIEGVDAEAEDAVIYDITGRRVEKITEEGIYIVNGKKVLVK